MEKSKKKYFWLKFKRDFFDDLRIKKLQAIVGEFKERGERPCLVK